MCISITSFEHHSEHNFEQTTINNFAHYFDQSIRKLSSRSSSRNAVLEQLETLTCHPGAAGQVEMSSWSSRTDRNVVPAEQQDRSKCRPRAIGQVEMSSRSSRTGRKVVPEPDDRSNCCLRAARQVPAWGCSFLRLRNHFLF